MAKVEVDEAELATMQRGLALLHKLNADPKAKPLLERSVKAVFPEVRTAEEEAEALAAPHLAKVQETAKALQDRLDAIDERERKNAEAAANNDLLKKFTDLKGKGYTDEGLQKIAGLMTERSIADPEAAAALFDRQNPKPAEVAPSNWEASSTRWDIQHNAVATDTKELFADPEAWGDREASKIIHEMRSQQAA